MKIYNGNDSRLSRLIGISWSETRWFRPFLFQFALKKQLIDDLKQTLLLAGVESYQSNLDPDINMKKICAIAQKHIYRFLKSNGLRKPKGSGRFISHETSFSDLSDLNEINKETKASLNKLFWEVVWRDTQEKEWNMIWDFIRYGKKLPQPLKQKLREIVIQ